MKVLLIGNKPELRDQIETMLADSANIQFIGSVSSGNESVRQVATTKPDIVLIDVSVGTLGDVVELLKLVKFAYAPVKTVLLSTSLSGELTRKAMAAGVNQFLGKPIDANELHQTLESLR